MPKTPAKLFKVNKSSLAKSVNKSNEYVPSLIDVTLFDSPTNSIKLMPPKLSMKEIIGNFIAVQTQLLKQKAYTFAKSLQKKTKVHVVWAGMSVAGFVMTGVITLVYPFSNEITPEAKYSIYASKPLSMREVAYKAEAKDARAEKIDRVFQKYKCPMEGMGEVLVREADKNNIPYWVVAAISFQESNCGKKTPEPGGLESYNAWGYGVYGSNVITFDNWARGVETLSKYLSKNFYSKGISDPCDIMRVYTPPSNGSWCEGVKFYGNEIQNYESPDFEIPSNS